MLHSVQRITNLQHCWHGRHGLCVAAAPAGGQSPVCPVNCDPLHSTLLQRFRTKGQLHRLLRARAFVKQTSRKGRCKFSPQALVAVEWNPAVFIGLALVGGGVVLYQLRSVRPEISRDFDIVASSVCIFSGGILITQGWRMDPIIIFENLLMTGLLMCWTFEAIRLREELVERQTYETREEWQQETGSVQERSSPFNIFKRFRLPPPQRPTFTRWDAEGIAQEGRQNMPSWGYGDQAEQEPSRTGGFRDNNTMVYPGEYSDVSTSGKGYVEDGQGFYRRPPPGADYSARDFAGRPSPGNDQGFYRDAYEDPSYGQVKRGPEGGYPYGNRDSDVVDSEYWPPSPAAPGDDSYYQETRRGRESAPPQRGQWEAPGRSPGGPDWE
eukprot:jgi/Botrbrau1/16472/Bobra.0142s0066.1